MASTTTGVAGTAATTRAGVAGTATATPTGVAGTATATTTRAATEGRTIIDDSVVAKVAGIAAAAVPGVHALGGAATRAFGAVRDAIASSALGRGGSGSSALGQGVRVEVGDERAAIELTIVVDHPRPIPAVAEAVRTAVATAVTEFVGLEVVSVDVVVTDVWVPALDGDVDGADVWVPALDGDVDGADVRVSALDGDVDGTDATRGRAR